jgi:hypothetical protein
MHEAGFFDGQARAAEQAFTDYQAAAPPATAAR